VDTDYVGLRKNDLNTVAAIDFRKPWQEVFPIRLRRNGLRAHGPGPHRTGHALAVADAVLATRLGLDEPLHATAP